MEFRQIGFACIFVVFFKLLPLLRIVHAEDIEITKSKVDDMPEEKEGMIRLNPPKLTEEEQNSPHMPGSLKCDGCRVIAYQLSNEFNEAHRKRPKIDSLRESEVIDIVESVCNSKFENYGLKGVDGVNRLSGPGLETEKSPGMMQGGGRWPTRLMNMCNYYVGELEEMGIYEGYKEDNTLEKFLCYDTGLRGECSRHQKQEL